MKKKQQATIYAQGEKTTTKLWYRGFIHRNLQLYMVGQMGQAAGDRMLEVECKYVCVCVSVWLVWGVVG